MINDPWQHMLVNLEPMYAELKDDMEHGQVIKATVSLSGSQWVLSINEKWGTVDDAGNHFNTAELDDRIIWATKELEKWDCCRKSWNMWHFKFKYDADKFITLYNLIWPM